MTLFQMEQTRATLLAEKARLGDEITRMVGDVGCSQEDLNKAKANVEDIKERLKLLDEQIAEKREAQRLNLSESGGYADSAVSKKEAAITKKAIFYRAALTGGDVKKTYEGLGGIPAATADLGNGDKLIPKQVSSELLTEPTESNPLRNIARITNITGLEEAKLGFTIEDADITDVTDQQTAKEIEMEGDSIVYGRNKLKITATVKDTVLYGTDFDIVSTIEDKLRAGLAKREKYFAFLPADDCATDTAHAHMSFYKEGVIAEVTGATQYEAIESALAELPDDYAANARVVMKKAEYYKMIRGLTNNSDTLFGSKPATILGYPVVFCDKATVPVVGDFSYYGINYDIGSVFETDKDAKKGEYYFVFTAWGDQQIRIKNAFRLAVVKAATPSDDNEGDENP